jgi:hypothetical protein
MSGADTEQQDSLLDRHSIMEQGLEYQHLVLDSGSGEILDVLKSSTNGIYYLERTIFHLKQNKTKQHSITHHTSSI